jgi:hypothetical protein
MRLLVFAALIACAAAAPASAVPEPEFSTREMRAITHTYAKCVVKKQHRLRGSIAINYCPLARAAGLPPGRTAG